MLVAIKSKDFYPKCLSKFNLYDSGKVPPKGSIKNILYWQIMRSNSARGAKSRWGTINRQVREEANKNLNTYRCLRVVIHDISNDKPLVIKGFKECSEGVLFSPTTRSSNAYLVKLGIIT
jgi:hypothetical protein